MTEAAPGLHADIEVTRAHFRLRLTLKAAPGQVIALLGPNGAGKSTVLRTLAGLDRPDRGLVEIDGETWEDTSAGVRVPVEQRLLGMVFQDYLLFPHLSALDNVAFGPRARGMTRAAARDLARTWLERVGLAAQADARPAELSGGQAQRVALARALAVRPRLLLLDEPLAALDAATRIEVRADLRHHLRDFEGSCVLVTHDPLDAMVLADRLIVLEDGKITHDGTPAEVASAPRTDYVAQLVGLNLYPGTGAGHAVRLAAGGELTVSEPVDGPVFAAFPPSAVAVFTARPHGSPRNCWPATVRAMEQHRDAVRLRLEAEPWGAGQATGRRASVLADVTPAAIADLDLVPGSRAWIAVKATEIRTYPA